MIFDKLSNMTLYKGMNPNLDTAIDFISSHDLAKLPLGRTEIDGDNVFLNKMEATSVPADAKQYEIHKKYMDIQIVISGAEQVDTGDSCQADCPDFSTEKDIGFLDCDKLADCILLPGNFTICMTEEPHKPCITVGNDTSIVKCVIKVHI